jgi:hypothetical protein
MKMQIGIPIERTLGVLALLVFSAFGGVGVSTTAGKQAVPKSVEPERGPKPPCSNEVNPPYPDLDQPVATKPWSAADLGRDWEPPTCLGWDSNGFTTLVTTIATFRFQAEEAGLLHNFGAFSQWKGLRYWSVTHKQWRTLITGGYALSAPQDGQRRADFTANEMVQENVLYFEQENNLTGKGTYRMQIVRASNDHIEIKIDNVSAIRYLLVPVLHTGDLPSVYFLDRESEDNWHYYSIVRTGKSASRLLAGNESSAINRAVAAYRHIVGIPDTTEPPAAR